LPLGRRAKPRQTGELGEQANRSLSNFQRKSPLFGGCHRQSLSSVEAADKPGAVHVPASMVQRIG